MSRATQSWGWFGPIPCCHSNHTAVTTCNTHDRWLNDLDQSQGVAWWVCGLGLHATPSNTAGSKAPSYSGGAAPWKGHYTNPGSW